MEAEFKCFVEFYFVETMFIFGINLLLQTCVQFSLEAIHPLKDFSCNMKFCQKNPFLQSGLQLENRPVFFNLQLAKLSINDSLC